MPAPTPSKPSTPASALPDPSKLSTTAVAALLTNEDVEVRVIALKELTKRRDPRTEPVVRAALSDLHPRVRAEACIAIRFLTAPLGPSVPLLIQALEDPDPSVRREAVETLSAQRVQAQPELVVAPLLERLRKDTDAQVRRRAAAVVYPYLRPGPPGAISTCLEALSDPEQDVCYEIVTALAYGWFPLPAEHHAEATKALLPLLSHPRASTAAARALAYIAPGSKETLAILFRDLKHSYDWTYRQAAEALVMMDQLLVQPELEAMVQSSDPIARVRGALATWVHVPTRAEGQRLLNELLRSDRLEERREALSVMSWYSFRGESTLCSAAIENLRHSDRQIRVAAATALGRLGVVASEATGPLLESLSDEDEEVRRQATEALSNICQQATKVVPALTRALDDRAAAVRAHAAYLLGNFGARSVEAVPALIRALDTKACSLDRTATNTLGKIGPAAREALPGIFATLHDKRPYYEVNDWVQAIHHIGLRAEDVPEAVKLLSWVEPNNQALVTAALQQLGKAAAPAAPQLRALCTGPTASVHSNIRISSLQALGAIGLDDGASVTTMLLLLDDEDERICVRAEAILRGWSPAVLEHLEAALAHPELAVRRRAVYLLGRLGTISLELLRRAKASDEEIIRSQAASELALLGVE